MTGMFETVTFDVTVLQKTPAFCFPIKLKDPIPVDTLLVIVDQEVPLEDLATFPALPAAKNA